MRKSDHAVIPSRARNRTAYYFRSDGETSAGTILRFAQDDSVIRLPCSTAVPPYRLTALPPYRVTDAQLETSRRSEGQ